MRPGEKQSLVALALLDAGCVALAAWNLSLWPDPANVVVGVFSMVASGYATWNRFRIRRVIRETVEIRRETALLLARAEAWGRELARNEERREHAPWN